jgi:hypothetical protein
MDQKEKEVLEAKILYLREQVKILSAHALRDVTHLDLRQEIVLESNLENEPIFKEDGSLNYTEEDFEKLLHWLSSMVDKTKSGGWIADRSAIYRVESSGRGYRNSDLISVQMANHDYNGADGNFARAKEVAKGLNSL